LTAQQADRLRRAERSARDLLDLINATLDLGRLDAGQVPLVVEHVNLRKIVAALANELAALRAREGVRFAWRFPADVPPIETDAVKLKVVLKHLIHNAFKFTESGAVSLRVRVAGERVEFEVRDTGVGIPPDMLDAIFEPFRQADSSSTRSYGGVGLGLFIVRRLLELLGGEIIVESELGRGSRFRFWIPLRLP
jgi:signal transduction histidine kinase